MNMEMYDIALHVHSVVPILYEPFSQVFVHVYINISVSLDLHVYIRICILISVF